MPEEGGSAADLLGICLYAADVRTEERTGRRTEGHCMESVSFCRESCYT